MGKISFVGASADDKAQLLGPEFRNIDVLDFEADGGVMVTTIIIEGHTIALVGDPQEALKTYLGGTSDQAAQ